MDWTAMAAPWLRVEDDTDATHAPVLRALMARAGLRPGQRVLDIGPGGGLSLLAAAEAVGPTGGVTGVEIAPPFAERARARTPDHVELVVADAQDHAFEPDSFDAAISLFGVMFFRDSEAAFANIRGALKPGGALHFACWGPPDKNPYFTMPARIAAGVFGPGEAFDPDGPGPMRFGDADALSALLGRAGWRPEIETLDLELTPRGTPRDVAHVQTTIGAAAMRIRQAKEAGTLTDTQREAVTEALTEAFAGMMHGGAVRIPANIHIVRAVR